MLDSKETAMLKRPLYPFHEEAGWLEGHCKLPVHVGTARLGNEQPSSHPWLQMFEKWQEHSGQEAPPLSEIPFDADFMVPATGNCLIFLRNRAGIRLNRNFRENLHISGVASDGPFEFSCEHYYVNVVSPQGADPAWAIASPVNCFASISYGEPRPITKVVALVNNFDFESGNVAGDASKPWRQEILRVEAKGHVVDFEFRNDRLRLRRLLDAGLLHTTALTTFSFAAWEGATTDDLSSFADNIASLCSVVARQHTGIPVLTFLDQEGRVVKRRLCDSIESEFRTGYVLRFPQFDEGLPKLFRQCFDEHVKMKKSELWKVLPMHCAGIEDPPYLEQKLATLMTAIEQLFRSSLIEAGHITQAEAERTMLPGLLGAVRRHLGWQIPGHYTARERLRLLRNAVAHGGRLPGNADEARRDFDKLRLFLMRRYLLRLGFDGNVASPHNGMVSSSAVGDFSEEHNSFEI
jgi:hypothetical protein